MLAMTSLSGPATPHIWPLASNPQLPGHAGMPAMWCNQICMRCVVCGAWTLDTHSPTQGCPSELFHTKFQKAFFNSVWATKFPLDPVFAVFEISCIFLFYAIFCWKVGTKHYQVISPLFHRIFRCVYVWWWGEEVVLDILPFSVEKLVFP